MFFDLIFIHLHQIYQKSGVKALAHYKDFHKDFSEKIFVKIFGSI